MPLDHVGEASLVVAVDDIIGGPLSGGVHAHVDRTLVPIRESAIRTVQLMARDSEVEERPTQFADFPLVHHLAQGVESGVRGGEPVAESLKAGARRLKSGMIAIEAEHP